MNATYYFNVIPRNIFEINKGAIIVLWNDICPESRIPDYFDRYGIKYTRQYNLEDIGPSIADRYLATVYTVDNFVTYSKQELYILAKDVLYKFMKSEYSLIE